MVSLKNSNEGNLEDAGQGIRNLRRVAGLSLDELAQRVGVDKARLSRLETNSQPLSLMMVERIAKGLERRPEAVLLFCLQSKYPSLLSSEVGAELAAMVSEIEGVDER